MVRLARIAIGLAGMAAIGLMVYELWRETSEERLPYGERTRFPEERPPFAEASQLAEG